MTTNHGTLWFNSAVCHWKKKQTEEQFFLVKIKMVEKWTQFIHQEISVANQMDDLIANQTVYCQDAFQSHNAPCIVAEPMQWIQ